MKLEATMLRGDCNEIESNDSKSAKPIDDALKARGIGLLMHDEVPEYTEKEARQYQENIRKYAPLHGTCVWVIGTYDKGDRTSMLPNVGGMIKNVTYIGIARP